MKKICSKCGIEKDIEEFYHTKSGGSGYRSTCKECLKACDREYYKAHKKEVNDRISKYRRNNKDWFLNYTASYRKTHKDEIRVYGQKWRKKNKVRKKKTGHEYYIKNKERIQKCQCVYRRANRDKIARRLYIYNKAHKKENRIRRQKLYKNHREKRQKDQRDYYEKNKKSIQKKHQAYSQTFSGKLIRKRAKHKRRAQERNLEATLTPKQWAKILDMQHNRCNICKKPFTKRRKASADHIIPLSRGGPFTFENVQALCISCNSAKQAKLDMRFILSWGYK